VVDFDESLNGTLVSTSVKKAKYETIRMRRVDGKVYVRFDQIIKCGKRYWEFVLVDLGHNFKGFVQGEKSNCSKDRLKTEQRVVSASKNP